MESRDDASNITRPEGAALDDAPYKQARVLCLQDFERRYLVRVIERAQGNLSAAARIAGLNRGHLYRLLWKHGLR
jgi:DNA-binding protein Fis